MKDEKVRQGIKKLINKKMKGITHLVLNSHEIIVYDKKKHRILADYTISPESERFDWTCLFVKPHEFFDIDGFAKSLEEAKKILKKSLDEYSGCDNVTKNKIKCCEKYGISFSASLIRDIEREIRFVRDEIKDCDAILEREKANHANEVSEQEEIIKYWTDALNRGKEEMVEYEDKNS